MKKLVISAGLVLAASIAFAPLAFAGENPPAPTCGQAVQDVVSFTGVVDAQKVLDQANFSAQIKALQDGPSGTLSLVALQKAVADGIAADNAAHAPVDSVTTVAAKAALKTRLDLIASVRAQLDAATKVLVDAKAKLTVLVTIRDKACAPPVVVPPTTVPATPTTAPKDEKDCADFPDQEAAQAFLDKDKTDPSHLDANHNGIACEGPADSTPPLPTILPVPVPVPAEGFSQVGTVPAGSVDTGGGPA